MLGGYTSGSFATTFTGDYGASDFLAVAIDEDGNELWRWQVRVVPEISIPLTSNAPDHHYLKRFIYNMANILFSNK